MKNALKRFFPVLTCVLILVASIIPASAADVGVDYDANTFFSVFDIDTVKLYAPVGSDVPWVVSVPYPGSERLNPGDFVNDGKFYMSYQAAANPTNARSRVTFFYGDWQDSVGGDASYYTDYQLTNVQSRNPATPVWSRMHLYTNQAVVHASRLQSPSTELPHIVIAKTNNNVTFVNTDVVTVTIFAKVSWYTEVSDDSGSHYELSTVDLDQTHTIDMSAYDGLGEVAIPIIPEVPDIIRGLDSSTIVSVEDLHFDISWVGLDGKNCNLYIRDLYANTRLSASEFGPDSTAIVDAPNFWSWLAIPFQSLFSTPIFFGWSLGELFSVVVTAVLIFVLLKYFAGG